MKASLAPKVRKSVLKELVFAKSDFLGLVNFGFLDLADFAVVNRFSKILPNSTITSSKNTTWYLLILLIFSKLSTQNLIIYFSKY